VTAGCPYPCVLRWSQRRFRCNDCNKTFRERHPEIAGRHRITERFRRALFERACQEPFTDVAASEKVSTYRVEEAFEAHAAAELIAVDPNPPRVLSIDESAFKRRFRFHTVFSDPELGTLLDLVDGRGKGAVFGGLLAMSVQVRAGIETVVMDCHWPYRRAIEEALPHARIVVDKFHIIRAVDAAAQRVRSRLGKRRYRQRVGHAGGIARQHHPANDPTIYGARWVFMKRADKLGDAEREWRWAVFEASVEELRRAWVLKELFAQIYDAPDRVEAERRLNDWIDAITRAGIPEFLNTWRTLQW
jgi:transposase